MNPLDAHSVLRHSRVMSGASIGSRSPMLEEREPGRAGLSRRRSASPLAGVALPLLAVLAGCAPHSVAIRTGGNVYARHEGPVQVGSTVVPDGAEEVGVVQVHGPGHVEDLTPTFVARVADLGGNFGLIEQMQARFETQVVTRTESYSCGTQQQPRTCSRTVQQRREVMITQLLGRAFRTAR
jgi:hypothetical protein